MEIYEIPEKLQLIKHTKSLWSSFALKNARMSMDTTATG